MKRGTCNTCAFFQDVHQECRYNPPTAQISPSPAVNGIVYFWPQVDGNDWCSHWRSALVGGQRKTYNHQINDGHVKFDEEDTNE